LITSEPSEIIYLIHGTWAPTSGWTKPNSRFRADLAKRLGRRIIFRRTVWSGANRHQARRAGAIRLRRKLSRSIKAHPTSRHWIIGHSHGGMVALYALRGRSLYKRVEGLICLGTPFIEARQRSETFRRFVKNMVAYPAFGIPAICAVLAIFYLFSLLPVINGAAYRLLVAFLMTCAVLGVFAITYLLPKAKFESYLDRVTKRTLSRLRLPRRLPSTTLAVRVRLDEALNYLLILGGVSDFPYRVFYAGTVLMALPGMFVAISLVLSLISPINLVGNALAIFAMSCFAISPLLLCAGTVSLASAWIGHSHGAAFGGENPIESWLVRTSARPYLATPAMPCRTYWTCRPLLFHTHIYDDARVLRDIAEMLA
jgi:pimeloyl-ACP methyl ester carboxylesterase